MAQFKNAEAFQVWVAFERDRVISGRVLKSISTWGGLHFVTQDEHTADNGVVSLLFIYQFNTQGQAEQFITRVRKLVEPHLSEDPEFDLTMEWEKKTVRVPVLVKREA